MVAKKEPVIHLVVIDPQNDFCNQSEGKLCVKGADADMVRLATWIKTNKAKLADIHITLDSHHRFSIGHPMFWRNAKGETPPPFTVITYADIDNKVWFPVRASDYQRVRKYVKELEKGNRFKATVWTEHCLIGSWGQSIYPETLKAIHEWESDAKANYYTKGSNPYTEHYSAIKAEVPDPQDPTTQLNTEFINMLEAADYIYIAGEASSHCVLNTVRDILDNFSNKEYAKKLIMLSDCMSPVPLPEYEKAAQDFFKEIEAKGVQFRTSADPIIV